VCAGGFSVGSLWESISLPPEMGEFKEWGGGTLFPIGESFGVPKKKGALYLLFLKKQFFINLKRGGTGPRARGKIGAGFASQFNARRETISEKGRF